MVRFTNYHNWSIPEDGDEDYETTFDNWWDTLDEEVIEKDSLSNRPPSGNEGRWYLATDEPAIYYDDGTTWHKIAGSNQSGNIIIADAIETTRHSSSPTAYRFQNDTNTGMFSPEANQVALATGGTSAFSIDENQDVSVDVGPFTVSDFSVEPTLQHPVEIKAGNHGNNVAMAIETDGDNTEHGNINWFNSSGNYLATTTAAGEPGGAHWSVYVSDADDVSTSDGSQKKGMDIEMGSGATPVQFPNISQLQLWNQTASSSDNTSIDLYANDGANALLRWFQNTGTSPGTGDLSYGLYESGSGDMTFYDYTNDNTLFNYGGSTVNFPTGLQRSGDTVAVQTRFPLPNSDLQNNSVAVAGNNVSLGGSTSVDLTDLTNKPHSALDDAPENAHHSKDHDHSETDISAIPAGGLQEDYLLASNYNPETDTHDKYTDGEAVSAAEAADPFNHSGRVNADTGPVTVNNPDLSLITNEHPLNVKANGNVAIDIQGDSSADEHGNINWHHSNGNFLGTISGHATGDELSFYVSDVDDVANNDGNQKKALDLSAGSGASNIQMPNLDRLQMWNQNAVPIHLDIHASTSQPGHLRWWSDTGTSPGTGTLNYSLYKDGSNNLHLHDYVNDKTPFSYNGGGLQANEGVDDADGNRMLDNVVSTGSVTLSSGSATIDTGVATTETATFMVALGPTTDDADVGADVRSDSGSSNYEVDIQETDTSVGNPSVEYDVIRVR